MGMPLKTDPLPVLFSCRNKAIEYFTRRDFLSETVEPIELVWGLPEVQKILQKQQPDGSWLYKGKETISLSLLSLCFGGDLEEPPYPS